MSARKGAPDGNNIVVLQEKELREEVEYKKIDGKLNPADLMTKYLLKEKLEEHSRRLSQRHEIGRADSGLKLHRGFEEEVCCAESYWETPLVDGLPPLPRRGHIQLRLPPCHARGRTLDLRFRLTTTPSRYPKKITYAK